MPAGLLDFALFLRGSDTSLLIVSPPFDCNTHHAPLKLSHRGDNKRNIARKRSFQCK